MASMYKEIPPHPSLSDFIECYWTSAPIDLIGQSTKHLVTPDNRVDFLFINGATDSFLGFSGPMTVPIYAINRNIFGIRFKLEHIYSIIGKPLNIFQDQFVGLEDVYPRHNELKDIFDQHQLLQKKIDDLNNYFISLIPLISKGSDFKLAFYLKRLEQGYSWKVISHEIGHSQQFMRRVFTKNVGLPPKKIEKIWRFNRAKSLILKTTISDFTDIALKAGYYDQAHFNHDFKELSGLSPSAWLN